jgi:hypothetical protein
LHARSTDAPQTPETRWLHYVRNLPEFQNLASYPVSMAASCVLSAARIGPSGPVVGQIGHIRPIRAILMPPGRHKDCGLVNAAVIKRLPESG